MMTRIALTIALTAALNSTLMAQTFRTSQPNQFKGPGFKFSIADNHKIQGRVGKPVRNATSKYPAHWGQPPQIGTHDYRPLPGGYGYGSSTTAAWIQKNLDADAKRNPSGQTKPRRFPTHWGQTPAYETRDYVKLPGSYGVGSSTLRNWIQTKLDADARRTCPIRSKYPTHWGQPPQYGTTDYVKLPGGYGYGSSTTAAWIQRNMNIDARRSTITTPQIGRPVIGTKFLRIKADR